jgi:hypothetical protein
MWTLFQTIIPLTIFLNFDFSEVCSFDKPQFIKKYAVNAQQSIFFIKKTDYPLPSINTSLNENFQNPNHKFEELVVQF